MCVCCQFPGAMSLVSSSVSSSSSAAVVVAGHARLSLNFLVISCFCFVSSLVAIADNSNSTTTTTTTTTTRRVLAIAPVHHQLTLDFYSKTCPNLEQLVSSVTGPRFRQSPVSGPATIRLFFHDCFVEGCDASILIAPGSEGLTLVEREMPENKNLAPEGFETVEMVKTVVESKCPGVVSCADILAISARDFVHLAGGPTYPVKKGRKDSKMSKPSKVKFNLPRSNSTVDNLLTIFTSKGLNQQDLVTLSGAHSIGFAHCNQFLDRLYNFKNTNKPDPSIDPRLFKSLTMYCPHYGGNTDIVAPLDVQTPFLFDHMYYGNLEAKLGLLETDQALYSDSRTQPLVQALGKDKNKFFEAFALAMDKMGSIRVKKGKRGEIRKVCSKHVI